MFEIRTRTSNNDLAGEIQWLFFFQRYNLLISTSSFSCFCFFLEFHILNMKGYFQQNNSGHRRFHLILPFFLSSQLILALSTLIILPTSVNSAALGMERREAPNQRNILLLNRSGRRIDIFWINRSVDPIEFRSNSENGEGYPFGASQGINSYIGHEFEIREMPSKKTGECQIPGDCQKGYFQVNDQEGQSTWES